LKRTITGIAAASMVLGTLAPMAFASTTASSSYAYNTRVVAVGNYKAQVAGIVAKDAGNMTEFIPIYYLIQGLKGLGYTVTWNGTEHSLWVTSPTGVTVNVPANNDPGQGVASFYLNNTVVQKAPVLVAKDPASGVQTAYVPIYYLNKLLSYTGITNTYDGVNWTLTAAVSPLAISSVKQTAATKVEVDFNQAVPTGTKVTLSQGTVSYTVTPTWNSTGSVATLDTGYNLPAGTYTITAGSLTQTVTIAAPVATTIQIGTKGFATVSTAAFNYTVLDQFGNVVSGYPTVNINAYDATSGHTINVTNLGSGSATLDLSTLAAKGDNIVVSVTDATDALSNTATIPVVGISNIGTLTLGAASDNGSANVNAGDTGVMLKYTATDAAGDSVLLPANQMASGSGVLDGIQFVSSDSTIVNPTNFSTDSSGNLTFTAGANTGTAIVTSVNLSTGQTSKSTITVGSTSSVKSFMMSAPKGIVTVGASTMIPYTAMDSFGNSIAQANFNGVDQAPVTFGSSNPSVVPAPTFSSTDNSLNVTPLTTGAATIYVYVGGVLQNSISLNVNAGSYPADITGVTSLSSYFENTANSSETLSASNLNVIDQYNQAYTPSATDTITVAKVSGVSAVTINGNSVTNTVYGTGSLTIAGTTTLGSEVLGVTVNNGTKSFTYDWTVNTVLPTAVTGYSLNAPTTLYDGVTGYVYGAPAASYAQAITLSGMTSGGQSVVLPTANQSPGYLTTSDSSIMSVNNSGWTVSGVSKGTATVTAYDTSGNKEASANVAVSDSLPVVKTVAFSASTYTGTHAGAAVAINALLSVTDQYGVTLPNNGYWVSSSPSVISGGSSLSGLTAGTSTLTFVTGNGVSAQITVTLS